MARQILLQKYAVKVWAVILPGLGQRHVLKGVRYLERAVDEVNALWRKWQPDAVLPIELKVVSDAVGESLERVWDWCDVLCLPTLSDNLGLVVAEAIERGRSVITTDGAPAWGEMAGRDGFAYLRGYRNGSDAQRVALLKGALEALVDK